MADNVYARKQDEWNSVSSVPDVCKTPMGGSIPPVPYNVISQLPQSTGTIGTVKANDANVWGFDQTKVPKTEGDEPGSAKGVKSGTVGEDTWALDKSSTVKAEDKEAIRHDDKTEMNGKFKNKAEEDKAKRRKCRKEQAEAAQQSKDKDLKAAGDRFRRNIDGAEYSRLSTDAYDPGKTDTTGWNNVSNDPEKLAKYGLTEKDLTMPGTNFRAQVYEPNPDVFGSDMKPTIAYQGTDPGSLSDLRNDAQQAVNLNSPYYERASSIANRVAASGADVTWTGHSLGGGLASASSQATGQAGWTFNAAGIHDSTVTGYNNGVIRGNGSQIEAYRVNNEPLTGMQEQGWKGTAAAAGAGFLVGGPIGALVGGGLKIGASAGLPNAVGNARDLPASSWSPLSKHGTGDVNQGIEKQKTEDQKKIEKKTGKKC